MTTALQNAQQAASKLAEQLGLVRDNGGEALREYTLRYRVVPFVDGQGTPCSGCGVNQVIANIYAREMDGDEAYAQTCVPCIFPTLDGQIDTDPSFIVTVEMPQ